MLVTLIFARISCMILLKNDGRYVQTEGSTDLDRLSNVGIGGWELEQRTWVIVLK